MPDKKQLTRSELIHNMEVLELENQMLSDSSEEVLLLQLVSDVLSTFDNEADILHNILERISVFLDIPFCAYCESHSEKTLIKSSHVATSNKPLDHNEVALPLDLLESIKGGPQFISKNDASWSGIQINLKGQNFEPENLALFHSSRVDIASVIFIFADDSGNPDHLRNKAVVLQLLIEKASVRLDNEALYEKLQKANAELKDLVKNRTDALHEVDDHFRRVINQSPSVIEIYDLDGLQINVNKAYEELWSFPASTTLNKFNLLLSEEVKKSGLLDYVKRAYAGESVVVPEYHFDPTGETEAQGKGRTRWLSTRIYPLKDATHKVKNVVITSEDITVKKLAEEELAATESRYRRLFEGSIDGICIINKEGRFADSNHSIQSLTGYSGEELNQMSIKDLVHPDDQAKSASYIKKLHRDGSYSGYEGRLISKNGDIHHVEVNSIAIYEKGEFYGSHDIIRDVTERKKSELDLKASQERFKVIFDDAPDAYYLADLKGTFVDGNKAAEKILGYKKEELIGENYFKFKLLQTKDLPRAAKNLALNVLGKPSGPDEFTLTRKDGSLVDVEVITQTVRINNKSLILGIARDITERKQTDKRLKQQTDRMNAVLSTTRDGFLLVSSEGRILDVNSSYCKMSGYSRDALLKLNISDLEIEISQTEIDRRLKRMVEQDADHFETRHKRIDGVEINLDVSVTMMEDPRGPLVAVFVRDIRERIQTENILRQQTERMNAVLRTTKDGFILASADGRILQVNDAYCKMIGYKKSKLLQMNISNLEIQLSKEEINQRVKHMLEQGADYFETRHKRNDGVEINLDVSVTVLEDPRGPLVAAFVRDITDRKRVAMKLAQSEEKYRLIVENANDGIEISQNDKIIFANTRFAEMLGYTVEELTGKSTDQLLTNQAKLDLIERSGIRISSGVTSDSYQSTFQKKDGGTINVEVKYEIIEFNGKPATFAIIRDITERKLSERVIKDSEERLKEALVKTIRANEVKDQFIANISHEIRTPLNSVIGFSDLLRTRFGDHLDTNERDIFGYITTAGSRLMKTVDSILNISQLEAGTITIHPVEVDLVHVVRSVVDGFKPIIEESQLVLRFDTKEQRAMIYVDEYCINQAIMNLVDNALKYTFEGSVKLKIGRRGDQLTLSIADTGIGIDEAYQERLFEPYTQESEGYTKKYQGIGLGMALTKRYLELNHVKLELDSKKNEGSTFTMIFPSYEEGEDDN